MSDSASADPRIGSEIAGYRIERLLGRGGMSVVYLAHDPRLDRRVALKLLAPELSDDAGFRERFLRESRLAASLDHPNVIPIHEAGEADGVLFIAMRYVDGTDLRRLLAEDGSLGPARVVGIVGRVAAALDAAHEQGLVHRDVKPGNVLITQRGGEEHVYLSDFGLTKQAGSESGLTQTGQFMGTVEYVAPEQIQGATVDGRADQYALACVLFECLTGEVPYGRDSAVGSIYAHLESEPPAASERKPELLPQLDAVLARGMAKDPEDRYRTAGELAGEARTALGLSGEIAQPVTPSRRGSRRLLVSAAVVAILAVVAAVVAVLVTGGGDDGATVGDRWSRVAHDVTASAERARSRPVVGSDGHFSDEQADAAIWTSPDGVSWTRVRDSDLFDPEAQVAVAVASGPGGFVAVGTEIRDGGEAIVPLAWTSSDGESWRRVVVDADGFVNAVAAGGPGLVAVGGGEVPVWTSPDGQSWTPGQADPQVFAPRLDVEDGFLVLQGVAAAADGRVVAVGWETTRSGTQVGAAWLSLDGVSWARVPHDDAVFGDGAGLTQVEDVVAGGPGFVAVGTEAEVAGGGIPFVYDQFAETSTTARGYEGRSGRPRTGWCGCGCPRSGCRFRARGARGSMASR